MGSTTEFRTQSELGRLIDVVCSKVCGCMDRADMVIDRPMRVRVIQDLTPVWISIITDGLLTKSILSLRGS